MGINEPRSSRLKDRKKGEGETVVKELFVQDVVQNNDLLYVLGQGSSVVLLPRSSSDVSVCSKLRVGSQLRVNPSSTPDLCSSKEVMKIKSSSLVSDDIMLDRNQGARQAKGFVPVKGNFGSLYGRNRLPSLGGFSDVCSSNLNTRNTDSERGSTNQGDALSDQRLFSCVTCGILSFACVAIVQPREPASRYLMSADCSFFNDWVVGSGVTGDGFSIGNGDTITSDQNTGTGRYLNVLFANFRSFVRFTLSQSEDLSSVAKFRLCTGHDIYTCLLDEMLLCFFPFFLYFYFLPVWLH